MFFELKTVTSDRRIRYRIQFHNGEGMRKSLAFVVFPSLLSLPLMTQDNSNVDVFGGCLYTYLGSAASSFANGRNTSLIVKINKPHFNLLAPPGSALSCADPC